MKTLFLTLLVIINLNAFSQNNENIKINAIERKLEVFKSELKAYNDKINMLTNTDSIKMVSNTLIIKTNDLIAELNKNFKINDDYLIEFSVNLGLSNTNPNLSSFYQTQAVMKLMEGEKAKKPNYYKNLIKINKLARQINKTNESAKIKVINNKINLAYQELISIKP